MPKAEGSSLQRLAYCARRFTCQICLSAVVGAKWVALSNMNEKSKMVFQGIVLTELLIAVAVADPKLVSHAVREGCLKRRARGGGRDGAAGYCRTSARWRHTCVVQSMPCDLHKHGSLLTVICTNV